MVVRAGTCEANTGTVAGNVDRFKDSFTWDGNIRETQLFNIVEEYEENENNEEVSEIEDQTPEEDGCRSGRRRGGSVLGATTDGGVLGASTDSCSMYINDYMQKGHSNSSEVEKLQNFLNQQGFVVAVTGVYGDATEEAVKQFQLKYKDEILMPWVNLGLSDGSSTGIVYKTTRWNINKIVKVLKCFQYFLN